MKNKIIYFDLDRTLFDSNKIRELTRNGICEEFNIKREDLDVVIDKYVATLFQKNFYRADDMLVMLSKNFNIDFELLKKVHDRQEYFIESLYDDTINTLKNLKENGVIIGIYSEGIYDWQMRKITLSGIYEYLDKDKIIIDRNKLQRNIVENMGEAVVVDDFIDVINYVSQYPQITPVWLNRVNDKKHEKVKTIFNLSEILNEIN